MTMVIRLFSTSSVVVAICTLASMCLCLKDTPARPAARMDFESDSSTNQHFSLCCCQGIACVWGMCACVYVVVCVCVCVCACVWVCDSTTYLDSADLHSITYLDLVTYLHSTHLDSSHHDSTHSSLSTRPWLAACRSK